MRNRTLIALGGSLVMGMTGAVSAEAPASQTDLQAQVAQLQQQVAQLQAGQNSAWLNERRAEEVKGLVREVLADADTRASMLETGMTAGHNKKNFFLASDDGNFLLNVSGQIQARYIANFRDDTGEDDTETGFQIRAAKVQFDGYIGSPSILYRVRVASSRNTGNVYMEEATVGYKLMDNLTVRGGRAKAPFMKEELIGTAKTLTVEQSSVNGIFSAGYVEGAFVTWDVTDAIRLQGALHDGVGSGESSELKDFYNDNTDVALAGRVDVRLMGKWAQADEFAAWDGDPTALFVGAAVNYDVAETGDAGPSDNDLRWTVDGQFKTAGFNAYAAFVGDHFHGQAPADNPDRYGLVAQAGYMVIPNKLEPFARFEWINFESVDPGFKRDNYLVTVGANYYIKKHSAKLTLDAVWAPEPLPFDDTAAGLLPDASDKGDQLVFRGQFQVLF